MLAAHICAVDQILKEDSSRMVRTQSSLALILLDIDDFKAFNDEFGHVSGDEALQQLARVLQSQARAYDRVARYGGEEFAIVLPDTTMAEALCMAERIRQEVQDADWPHRPVTVSLGVAVASTAADCLSLVERARLADCWWAGIIRTMPLKKPVASEFWRMSVAPMMDWTDRHCRYFHRLLTRQRAAVHRDGDHRCAGAWRCGAPPALQRRGTSGGAAAGRQRAGRPGALRRRWASSGATTRSTSTAAARASACSAVPSAPA